MSPSIEEVLLAEPRGFCAGVDRAIEIVERALTKFGAPIYVRHEIVHNTYVVNDLKAKGAIFIEDLADVPPGATLVFSAHGVSQAVRREAAERGFSVFDATCPLVTKVHVEVAKLQPRRLRIHHDRPQGAPRGRRHDGPAERGHPPGRGCGRCRAAAAGADRTPGGRDADHPVGRRRGRDPGRRQATLSVGARAEAAGHLLCNPEPAGCGQGAGAAGRRADRRRQPDQFEQQPLARTGRAPRHRRLHGRFARRPEDRVVRRQAPGRTDRRRIGARHPRRAGDRPPARARRRLAAAHARA